jgi:hypothetical protein
LPKFGVLRKNPKIIVANDISTINQDLFIKRKDEVNELENDEPIEFRKSLIRFSLEPGCKAGI